MIAGPELDDVLAALPRVPVVGKLFRAVPNEYLQEPPPGSPGDRPEPLWPGGASLKGARYTPRGGANTLYLAPDPATALAEVDAVVFSPDLEPGEIESPLVTFQVNVVIPETLDLCTAGVQRRLGTTDAELTAPWLRAQERYLAGNGEMPATQLLGHAAAATKTILALAYPSYKSPGKRNVVVFTDKLGTLSGRVTVVDRSGLLKQSLP